jgi:DNA polymerase elongation subunit (family B)
MLKYGLCSSKDPEHRFLGVLQYMTQARLKLKKELKKYDENTPEYNEINHNQNALKILINGSYGFFGTGGYSYNDYYAAALVTAYGRKILRLMEDVIMGMGGNLIESDTDGVIFQSENPERIYKRICERLPEGIKTDLELQGCVAYVPKAKNYIILPPVGDPKHKGSKRSDIPLLNQFKIGYIQAWKNSQQAADQYYLDVIDSLNSGAHPIADLTITRKISKSEKHLVNLGIGQPGDIVSYYYGSVGGKPLEVTQGSPYHPGYYIKKIQAFLNEVDARYDNAQLSLVV